MADNTKIEWAHSTMNGWWGCQAVSEACKPCYAEALAKYYGRVEFGPGKPRLRTSEKVWAQPLIWQKNADKFQRDNGCRQRVFCLSMGDFFDNAVPPEWRADLWELIRRTPDLDWLVLTKRPMNIRRMLPSDWGDGYRNVWLGATTEDQETFDLRWPLLRDVPAHTRFLSYEPAVGPLQLEDKKIQPDWIIAGGVSRGGGKVPLIEASWARSIRDQCVARDIPFFFKQWGEFSANPLVTENKVKLTAVLRKSMKLEGKGGAMLDGKMHRAFPPALAA